MRTKARRMWREDARLLGGLLLLATGSAPAQEAPSEGGSVVQAEVWRAPGDGGLQVDFAVQLSGGTVYPGMLLTATRPSRLGRAEGPPYLVTGNLRVFAVAGPVAMARAVPARPGQAVHPEGPGVRVGDLVRPAGDVLEAAPGGAAIELKRLFPGGDAQLAADADALLTALVQPVGRVREGLLVVYYDAQAATPDALALAYRQAEVAARRAAEALVLSQTQVQPVLMPLPGQGLATRAELRATSIEGPGNPVTKPGAP